MIIFIGNKNYKDNDNIYKNDKDALISIPLIILTIIGILFLLVSSQFALISLKPVTSFEDMLRNTHPKEGIHIESEITYITDYFAVEESYSSIETGRYYLIPTSEDYITIKNDKYISMDELDKLMNETYDFIRSGKEPSTKIFVQGTTIKMDDQLKKYYEEYFLEAGYSESEIESMDPLMITHINFHLMQILFFTGAVITPLSIFALIYIYRKNGKLF